jgi:predicted peroxiredoxin
MSEAAELRGKKLGVLIACKPDQPGFRHGLHVAEAAMKRGVHVYLYCIDEAVSGVTDAKLQQLKSAGLNLYACAYGAHKRHIPLTEHATFAGLTVVNDLMAGTDRFVCFN